MDPQAAVVGAGASIDNNSALKPPPQDAVQCPITHPFSKYGDGTNTVSACCKCGDQVRGCKAVGDITDRTGINYYNYGGVKAMIQKDDVVDKSK